MKTFSRDLHYYSPRAYKYTRKSLGKNLPHPKTLQNWVKHIECKPGLSFDNINLIEEKVIQAKKDGKTYVFNMTVDELSIRKRVEWNGKEFVGFVDLGSESHLFAQSKADEMPAQATHCFVILLVCINGSFKMPIANYFIDALSGDEKGILV